jgi:hypothetical protein
VAFFREYKHQVAVGYLEKRTLIALIASVSVLLCLVTPVCAYYFEFDYFETDKLVYEVGETVNMVARLTADFSPQGWCYISFAVTTDQGPVFGNSYFISSSTEAQFFNSSYTIVPEDTSPGPGGTEAYIIFTVEIYDSYSQGDGDTVQINITRGSLQVSSLSPLSLESDDNTTLIFKVTSAHNDAITYADSPVTVTLLDSFMTQLFQEHTTTSSDGMVDFNWNSSMAPPGDYTLTLSSNGTEDFLPFSQSSPITVTQPSSNLTVVAVPVSVYCQTPDGAQVESVDISAEQQNKEGEPITDSTILWETAFSAGTMTHIGSGVYHSSIPFETEPGLCHINLTANNPLYMTEYESITIQVLPRPLQITSTESGWDVQRGGNVSIAFDVDSIWLLNQSVSILLTDSEGQLDTYTSVNANTYSEILLSIDQNASLGPHTFTIEIEDTSFQHAEPSSFEVFVYGTINAQVEMAVAYYAEELSITLNITDDNSQSVIMTNLSLWVDNLTVPAAHIENVDVLSPVEVFLPSWVFPGLYEMVVDVESPWCGRANVSMPVVVWMRTSILVVVGDDYELPQMLGTNQRPPSLQTEPVILSTISAGSIIRPPPILVNDTTSTELPTARETSRESCPRLSSGTNNDSTDPANSASSASGNGQSVLNLRDLIFTELFVITSSTDLDVHPYETTPQSADFGPDNTTSVRSSRSF